MSQDDDEIERDFAEVVNMPPAKLRKWLESDDSKSVGMTKGGDKVTGSGQSEAVGHHMGERILEIKARKKSERDEKDHADMRKVVGYVKRHSAQKPKGDTTDTDWRYSLMNWGNDPEK